MILHKLTPNWVPLTLLCLVSLCFGSSAAAEASLTDPVDIDTSRVQVPFVENRGQMAEEVAYMAQTFAGRVFVTHKGELVTTVQSPDGRGADSRMRGVAIFEQLLGGQVVQVQGEAATDIKVSYMTSPDEADWNSDVPNFDWVSLGEVYPGVEMKIRARGANVEKFFFVAPGADPAQIKVGVKGIEGLQINQTGQLELLTGLGRVTYTAPVAWQPIDGDLVSVPVTYDLGETGGPSYGFLVPEYDPAYPLVIDPLIAATVIGGAGDDLATSAAIANNSVYIVGDTESVDFPTTPGAFDTMLDTRQKFVARLSLDLTALEAATYIGQNFLSGSALSTRTFVDTHAGDVYVAFSVIGPGSPIHGSSYDQTYNGGTDGYLARFNSNLDLLLGTTYFGGSDDDQIRDLDVDAVSGAVCIGGDTQSGDMPVTGGAHDTSHNGGPDGFISCFNSGLTALLSSSFYGTSGSDLIEGIYVSGSLRYASGATGFPLALPTPNGAFQTPFGTSDGFIALFNSSMQLASATLIGGDAADAVGQVRLFNGKLYAGGTTQGGVGFPGSGGLDPTHNGLRDYFVARFDSLLSTLEARTFLGGTAEDRLVGMELDSAGNLYLLGFSVSTDFPTTQNSLAPVPVSSDRMTLTKLNPGLSSNLYSTWLRGANIHDSVDRSVRFGVPNVDDVYIASRAGDAVVTTASAYQTVRAGGQEGLVSRISTQGTVTELSMGFVSIDVAESVGTLNINVTRTGDLTGLSQVVWQTTDGTAISGVDYVGGPEVFRWEPGDGAPKTISIQIQPDFVDEMDEDFSVNLINPYGANIALLGGGRTINIIDDDTAGVTVGSPSPSANLTELNGVAAFHIRLDSQPESGSSVFVTAFSDDTSAGTLDSADNNGEVLLTFDNNNWNILQTIGVTSVDDDIDDGDQPFQVDFLNLLSPDPNYDGIVPPSVDLVTVDDETAGIIVDSVNMPLVTSESGSSDMLSYRLASEPLNSVQLNLTPDAEGQDEGMLSDSSLTFTPTNWDVLQPVTVTGLDDMIVDGDILYQILFEGVSSDPLYDFSMTSFGAMVINQDDDALPVDLMVTLDDGQTQMLPFIPALYRIDVVNLSGETINDVEVVTTSTRLDETTMSWTCQPQQSNCDVLSGTGNVNTTVDLDPFGTVLFEVTASAVNQPFEQATLSVEAIAPFGTSDTNPANNFAMDSNLIFVSIIFSDGLESP